ncbi:MAG: SCP2 sterol-binding domain-containing protein [Candidatus Freyarchaeum deiterrae]
MADVNNIVKGFKKLADAINENDSAKSVLAKWLDGYVGRIHAFEIDDKKFHIVFWPDEAKFVDGEASAPDLVIRATADAWTDMVTGKKKWSDLLGEGTLFIIGAANEIQSFIQIAMTAGVIPSGA